MTSPSVVTDTELRTNQDLLDSTNEHTNPLYTRKRVATMISATRTEEQPTREDYAIDEPMQVHGNPPITNPPKKHKRDSIEEKENVGAIPIRVLSNKIKDITQQCLSEQIFEAHSLMYSKREVVWNVSTKQVYQVLRENELRTAPAAGYLSRQTAINARMRELLINWMVEVVMWFDMTEETLFLAVNYVDRFLASQNENVQRSVLQMLGTAALFTASKFQEITPPICSDFASMISKTTKTKEITAMEMQTMSSINFDICAATSLTFLQGISYRDPLGPNHSETLWNAIILCELGLLDYDLLAFKPSVIASSCWYLVKKDCQMHDLWNQHLIDYTEYHEHDLFPCIMRLDYHRHAQLSGKSPIFGKKQLKL